MASPQELYESIQRQVGGFMRPEFIREEPDGRQLFGLNFEDTRRVMTGYGCPSCMAWFHHYTVTCPCCHHTRDVAEDLKAPPQEWVQHLEDRRSGYAPTVASNPLAPQSIEQVVAELRRNPDVENVKL